MARYAEFADGRADTAQVAACLAEAQRRLDEPTWGAIYEDGVYALTAHLLATSPWGQHARLEPGATSTYEAEFLRMQRSVALGPVVTALVT